MPHDIFQNNAFFSEKKYKNKIFLPTPTQKIKFLGRGCRFFPQYKEGRKNTYSNKIIDSNFFHFQIVD